MSDTPKQQRSSKEGLAIGVTILVLIVVGAAIAYNALAPQAAPSAISQGSSGSEAQTAPELTVMDVEGNEVHLSQMRGKPVVLNFWASTCGPCQSEMPGFQQAWEQHGSQVQFMMVDIPGFNGETADRAKGFIEQKGYGFPVYFDADGSVAATYGLTSIPRTYFIDADGRIVASAAGALSESQLAKGIELLL